VSMSSAKRRQTTLFSALRTAPPGCSTSRRRQIISQKNFYFAPHWNTSKWLVFKSF
jgi:hypothetical protein